MWWGQGSPACLPPSSLGMYFPRPNLDHYGLAPSPPAFQPWGRHPASGPQPELTNTGMSKVLLFFYKSVQAPSTVCCGCLHLSESAGRWSLLSSDPVSSKSTLPQAALLTLSCRSLEHIGQTASPNWCISRSAEDHLRIMMPTPVPSTFDFHAHMHTHKDVYLHFYTFLCYLKFLLWVHCNI